MSARSLRYSSPASGDDAVAAGRHRRPESLADAPRPWLSAADASRRAGSTERRIAVPTQRATRSDRHQQRDAPDRRRIASHRAVAGRPPVAGSHRAPGTLPIESWLLLGRPRRQALLASLVAAGLLLLALPTGGPSGAVDAVDAAAQRALGVSAAQNKSARGPATGSGPAAQPGGGQNNATQNGAARPAPSTSAPGATDPPDVGATAAARQTMTGAGPARSLLTTGTAAVSLTFDDGPDPVQTPRILELLDEHQVKAVFCLVGVQVQRHPEIVRQIVAAGHTLCNHTWNHSFTLGKDDPKKIRADLARTNAAIRAAVPGAPIPFFRAPGGNFTDRLVAVATADGMSSIYWQVDPRDWYQPADENDASHVTRVVADIRTKVRPGSIVLSHDFNQPATVAAYEKLLPWLTENFTLGIPGEPAPVKTTPPTSAPTPSESPATPDPSPSSTSEPTEPQTAETAATSPST